MIVRKLVLGLAALCAVGAAAGVAVIAAAFAVYALLRDPLGPAGAAGAVAALAAVLTALAAVIMALMVVSPRRHGADATLPERAFDFARARPLLALGAAALVGMLAVRNPKIVTAAFTAFMAGKATPKH